ncbi:ABC transporter substrate-binding protein [Fundidesulfovibrio putealis]|uniref:ABC transporter substrate-binding protein n=1 Tax=Fundidesulfovibrio putealis TaxID=270496 RepID=UPI0004217FA4|nr:extracellular solute-binding protein [Fundidesulfovibrio putealis]
MGMNTVACRAANRSGLLLGTALAVCILLCCARDVPASPGGSSVQFLHYWTGALSGGVGELVDAYNRQHPPVGLSVSGMEHETFKSGIKGLLISGRAPGIFSYWAGARTQAMVDAGHLVPIDDIWAQSGLDEAFSHAVADACTYDGKKYAIPVTQHLVAFFYDVRLFKRLGLAPPKDWAQFLDVCEAIRQAGVTPLALGSREAWPAQFWFDYLLLRTAGPAYRQRLMEGSASYGDPEVRAAFAMWRELLERRFFNPSPESLDWAQAAALVRQGKAGMTLMGTWAIGLFNEKLEWEEESGYDFFVFPVVDPAAQPVALGPIDVLVASRVSDPAGAKAALSYFAMAEPQMEMSRGSGALAPNLRVPESFYSPLKQRILKAVRETPNWAFAMDLSTPPPAADVVLGTFSAFLRNPEQMDRILAATQRKLESSFKATGSP